MIRWRLISIITLFFFVLIIFLLADLPGAKTASASLVSVNETSGQMLASNNNLVANCRYGATSVGDSIKQTAVISRLGAGWYLTFNPIAPSPPPENGADFAHMIRVKQKKDGSQYLQGFDILPPLDDILAFHIQNNPGDLWIIGNEVDRGPSPGDDNPDNRGQGDTHPEIYALAYHDVYEFIKNVDPTAQVAISGLVEVTPGRLQYLDKVWNAYLQEFDQLMPVDIWTMHLYILPEVQTDGVTPNGIANVALGTNPTLGKRESGGNPAVCSNPDVYCFAEHDSLEIFAEQAVAMRHWMAQHGQRQKPLLLTEYSILYPFIDDGDTCFLQDEFGKCFEPERVSNFMTQAFDYLNNSATDPNLGYSLDNNRLIQQYMWFSVYNEGVGDVSNLVENDLVTFSSLGQNFKNYVFNEALAQNLLVDQVADVVVIPPSGGTATAEISVTFRNNGNTKVDQPFTATFYEDAAFSKPIAAVEISVDVLGCASRPYVASAEWPGLAEGVNKYWVKIDSHDAIEEVPPGNIDNTGSGWVMVPTNSALIPIFLLQN
jgi:hypothetical protein